MIDTHSHPTEVSNPIGSPNMRRADAARYIRETYGIPCVHTTLAKYACIGNGPLFRKAGKFPLYSRNDLDAWAKERLGTRISSTSELSEQKRESAA